MRRALSFRTMTVAVTLLLLGCGGLENAPLEHGIVRGHVHLSQAPGEVVVGGMRGRIGEDGRFEVQGVPAGRRVLELASTELCGRQEVAVPGGGVADVGLVTLVRCATLRVELRLGYALRDPGARVTVEGTNVIDAPFGGDGSVTLSPLTPGCYSVRVDVPGLGERQQDGCATVGQLTVLPFEFTGDLSCTALAGCIDGFRCGGDGQCTFEAACHVCDDEAGLACPNGGVCVSIGGGNKACHPRCGAQGSCEGGRACLTDPMHAVSWCELGCERP